MSCACHCNCQCDRCRPACCDGPLVGREVDYYPQRGSALYRQGRPVRGVITSVSARCGDGTGIVDLRFRRFFDNEMYPKDAAVSGVRVRLPG